MTVIDTAIDRLSNALQLGFDPWPRSKRKAPSPGAAAPNSTHALQNAESSTLEDIDARRKAPPNQPPGRPPNGRRTAPDKPLWEPVQHRTLFLSDIHLGTPGCKADLLVDFLRHNHAETIYLVGDIVDGWRLKRSWYWTDGHNAVVQEVLRRSRKGTKVIYVPGNHDEALRDYTDLNFGGVDVIDETVHITADGRRLLVLHGDQFDSVVTYARWLAKLGDRAYSIALALNTWLHAVRRAFGRPYWSLSAYLKHRVKNAVEYVSSFEQAVARAARERGVDGVVCGHIHQAEIRDIDGILYCNDGDWVESCTALAEDERGELRIIVWQRFSWEMEPADGGFPAPRRPALTAA